jgi:Ni,Fe-hydrogenase maturation factor
MDPTCCQPALIAGVGNIFLSDDALGPAVF